MTTLEVLVPTFGRPLYAIRAIKSVLKSENPRVSVRCSSNLFEPEIKSFSVGLDRLTYTFFEENRGLRSNFRALLESCEADFSLFLSDEDKVISEALDDFLDFLSSLPSDTSAVGTSVADIEEKRPGAAPGGAHPLLTFDYPSYLALAPLSTYISGLVFSDAGLKRARGAFDEVFQESKGNVYPHLDLVLHALPDANLVIWPGSVVRKGAPAGHGGDSHSHVKGGGKNKDSGPRLNPEVYGPYARVRQFFFRESALDTLQQLSWFFQLAATLRLMTECNQRVRRGLLERSSKGAVLSELSSAVVDARAAGEFSGSWAANFVASQASKGLEGSRWLWWSIAQLAKLCRGAVSRIYSPLRVQRVKRSG